MTLLMRHLEKALETTVPALAPARILWISSESPHSPILGKTVPKTAQIVSIPGLSDLDGEVAPFDLIVVAEGLEAGGIAEVSDRLNGLVRLVRLGGHIVLAVSPLAAPLENEAAAYDALLFPEAASSGDLGDEAAFRSWLAPSTWVLLAQATGLRLVKTWGFNETPLTDTVLREHEARLASFDPAEIATGALIMLLGPMEHWK